MKLRVECYAGRKADERPVFKVRADDRNLYILWRNTSRDEWTLESFRQLND
jgi:hypothetical protein